MAQRLTLQIDLGNIARTVGGLKRVRGGVDEVGEAAQNAARAANQLDENFGQAVSSADALGKALFSSSDEANKLAESLGLTAEQALQALRQLEQLREEGKSTEDQFAELSKAFNLNQEQFNSLGNAIDEGAQRTNEYLKNIQALTKVSRDLNLSFDQANALSLQTGLSPQQIQESVKQIRELRNLGADLGTQFDAVSKTTGVSVQQFNRLSEEIDNASSRSANLANQSSEVNREISSTATSTGSLTDGLAGAAFAFNNVLQAAQTLFAFLRPAYDLLIGQNEQLNQQLLSAQSSLAATNQILQNGIAIQDPTEAIQALDEPIRAALAGIREESLALVGVTSGQLVETFQILLTQASQLTNQSQEFPTAIAAAERLTIDFAAALGTLGIPLAQQRQELNSIVTGTIDQNSVLAKSLNITNEQVRNWQAQGRLVDELSQRLQPFVAGNALAAQSISGISSNIQEIIETVALQAGEPLFEEAVVQLQRVFDFLEANQDQIQEIANDAGGELAAALSQILDGVTRIADVLTPIFQDLGEEAGTLLTLLQDGFILAAQTAAQLTETLQPILPLFQQLSDILLTGSEVFGLIQSGLGLVTGSLGRSNEAVEIFNQTFQDLQNASTANEQKLTDAIENRNQALEEGRLLTEAEQAAERQAIATNQNLIQSLEEQKRAIRETVFVGDENKEAIEESIDAIDAQIDSLKEQANAFNEVAGSIEIVPRELNDLGTAYEQLEEKVTQAQQRIADGAGGDSSAAQKAAQEIIKLTQQQVELGQLSEQQAVERLRAIAENTQLEFGEQLAAQDAITKLLETESNERVQIEQRAQSEIRQAIAEGRISDIEGERQLTEAKARELEIRLADVRRFLEAEQSAGRGDGARAQQLLTQEAELAAELAQTRADGQRLARDQVLQELERSQREQTDLIRQSEIERQTQIQQLINDGVLSQENADRERLQSVRERIEAELNLERERLAQLQALPEATDPDERDRQESEIRAAIRQTSELQLSLLENERQQQEAVAQEAIQAIRDQATASEQASQRQIAANDAVAQSLQRQSQLLDAQQSLRRSLNQLDTAEGQTEIDRLNEALQLQERLGNEQNGQVRQVIQARLRELGIQGNARQIQQQIVEQTREQAQLAEQNFQREAQFRRQQLNLQIQLNQAASERLAIEAQLAQVQAQASLSEAEQIVDPAQRERAIQAAQLQSELANRAVDEARAQADLQSEIADAQQRALEADLDREEAALNATNEASLFNAQLREAEQLSQAIADNLNGVGLGGGGISLLPGRRTGGSLEPGGVYRVHKDEIITTSPTGGYVLNRQQSQAIAKGALSNPSIPGLSGLGSDFTLSELRSINRNLSNLDSGAKIGALNSPTQIMVRPDKDEYLQEIGAYFNNLQKQLFRNRSVRF